MQLRPIVDGIQAMYDAQVTFVYLNAADGDIGEDSFNRLGLPGHPGIVIFDAGGLEQFRSFGVIEEDDIIEAIEKTLRE